METENGNRKWKRKVETENGKRKRKSETEIGKGKGSSLQYIQYHSTSQLGMQGQDRSSSSKSRGAWVGVKP